MMPATESSNGFEKGTGVVAELCSETRRKDHGRPPQIRLSQRGHTCSLASVNAHKVHPTAAGKNSSLVEIHSG